MTDPDLPFGPFPFPFSGIVTGIRVPDHMMAPITEYMANGCVEGHQHNVAFQYDGGVIWTSSLGVDCIMRFIGSPTERNARAYDVLQETAQVLGCPEDVYPPEHAHAIMARLGAVEAELAFRDMPEHG